MARQVTTEIVDTPEGKRLRIQEVQARQQEVDAATLGRILDNLDGGIAERQAELAQLQAERSDLAGKLAELRAAEPIGEALPAEAGRGN